MGADVVVLNGKKNDFFLAMAKHKSLRMHAYEWDDGTTHIGVESPTFEEEEFELLVVKGIIASEYSSHYINF